MKILLATLKDKKKFDLSDEIKGNIVECLLTYLKSLIADRLSSNIDSNCDVEQENQLFEALTPFKSNFHAGCVDILGPLLIQKSIKTSRNLQYCFKIYQITLNNIDKASSGVIKSYMKFHDSFAPKALAFGDPAVIIQILETNNSLLKESRFQLDNTVIDEFLCISIDPRIQPATFAIEDFCKFYSAIGESLFLIANSRQNYFKSRISQYFNVYRSFMDAIYFFKNDQPEEISPMEISLLLTLTLQLEKYVSKKILLQTNFQLN